HSPSSSLLATHRGTQRHAEANSYGDAHGNVLQRCADDKAKDGTNCEPSTGLLGFLLRIARSKFVSHFASTVKVGLTPQFSGGALPYVPWLFMHDRPLQLLVRHRRPKGSACLSIHLRYPRLAPVLQPN